MAEHTTDDAAASDLDSRRFAEWSAMLRRAVMPIVRDLDAAADICQETWVRFIQNQPDDVNLEGWLVTVARRLALNHVASGAVRFRASGELDESEHTSPAPGPAEDMHRREERRLIGEAFERMDERHRRAVELCDVQLRSYAEAAKDMGLTEAGFTSLLFRARKSFRREYLLAAAPRWVRALAEAGTAEVVGKELEALAPLFEESEELERRAHGLFARLAPKWDRIRSSTVPDGLDAAVAERAELAKDDWALDAGTGTGIVALHVAKQVHRVVGVDRSLPMLRVAQDNADKAGSDNVLMEYGDLNRLAFRGGSFDVAFCSLVLRHLRRPDLAISALSQVLRQDGRLVICDQALPSASSDEPGIDAHNLGRWLDESGMASLSLDRVEGGGKDFLIAVARKR